MNKEERDLERNKAWQDLSRAIAEMKRALIEQARKDLYWIKQRLGKR